jgi:hypothetical protein
MTEPRKLVPEPQRPRPSSPPPPEAPKRPRPDDIQSVSGTDIRSGVKRT